MDLIKWLGELPQGIDGRPLPPSRIDTLSKFLQKRFGKNSVLEHVHRLRSRKNVVLHLTVSSKKLKSIELVAKMFVDGMYDTELRILLSSWKHHLAVPEVLEARDGVILMPLIPGRPLVDVINSTFDPLLIDKLAQWYYNYHSAHRLIKGDPRLRNFLYHENTLYGIDFEESRLGSWTLDIAGISASLLDTHPIFDPRKRTLCWRLLDAYLSLLGQERDATVENEFTTVVADTLQQTSVWRRDSKILELSERIRTEGLPKS
jgi:tRNA A-37 threonylcarbamoyl transferase component Bud32